MVAGGFTEKSVRTDTIELYDEVKDIWYIIGCLLPFPLEASFF